jgi:hypothetical protein
VPSGIASVPHSERDQEPEAPRRLLFRARFQSIRLDRLLAGGTSPDDSPRLKDRARLLTDIEARQRLAASIDGLVVVAASNQRGFVGPARAPLNPRRVIHNRAYLDRIAENLRRSHPPAVRGIAMTSNLLRDNRSPLYANDSPENLGRALAAIVAALEGGDG